MSFTSRFVTTALVAGGLFVAGNSYAHQLQCSYGRYAMLLQNQYPYGGNYNVACTNGYLRDSTTVYVGPHSAMTVAGNFNGNVTCTVAGATSMVYSGFCP